MENKPAGNPVDFLGDVVADMPTVTPVADTLTQEATHENEKAKAAAAAPQAAPEKKKRGRPKGTKNAGGVQNPKHASRIGGVQSDEQRLVAAQNAERIAAAAFLTAMMETSGVSLAGDDGRMNEAERLGLIGSWDKYLAKAGINDIPPGLALVLVTGQYYGRVLMAPQAAPKTAKIKAWFYTKIEGLKNARSNRRNDRKRKNNAGENAGETVQGERDEINRS